MNLMKRVALIVSILACISTLFCLNSAGQTSGTQIQYFPHFVDGAGYSSAWQFTGLNLGSSVITVELFDQGGNPLNVATDQGTSSIFRFVLQNSSCASLQTLNSGNIKVGWARVTATQPIGATETYKLAGPSGAVISETDVLAAMPVTAATLLTPDSRSTAVALANINSSATAFNFKLLDNNGNTIATGIRTLGPSNQMALYVNQIPGLENATVLNGSLEVSSSASFPLVTLVYDGPNFATAPVLPARSTADYRTTLINQMTALQQQFSTAVNQFLQPTSDELAPYAAFLNQPQTGMVVLTPRGQYAGDPGTYYSFSRLTHQYGYGSDIELEQGSFSVGFAGYDFGFYTALGDVPIDGVTTTTPAVQYLAAYVPPTVDATIRAEQQRSGSGFYVGPYYYRDYTGVQLNKTYVLRSISYDRSDVLVALRVVQSISDGSVIIIWKQLASFVPPHGQ
jgi:hypothetical protein